MIIYVYIIEKEYIHISIVHKLNLQRFLTNKTIVLFNILNLIILCLLSVFSYTLFKKNVQVHFIIRTTNISNLI